MKPNNANGIITMYTLDYSYTLEGKAASYQQNLSNDDFSFQFNVFGGLQYIVRLWAETVKPGPAATESVLVPTYSKYGYIQAMCQLRFKGHVNQSCLEYMSNVSNP